VSRLDLFNSMRRNERRRTVALALLFLLAHAFSPWRCFFYSRTHSPSASLTITQALRKTIQREAFSLLMRPTRSTLLNQATTRVATRAAHLEASVHPSVLLQLSSTFRAKSAFAKRYLSNLSPMVLLSLKPLVVLLWRN